jgi:hypothetical protein
VSRRLRRCPPELKSPHLDVRPCPPRAAWCQESVTRRAPQKGGEPAATSHIRKCHLQEHVLTRSECVDLVGRGGLEPPASAVSAVLSDGKAASRAGCYVAWMLAARRTETSKKTPSTTTMAVPG